VLATYAQVVGDLRSPGITVTAGPSGSARVGPCCGQTWWSAIADLAFSSRSQLAIRAAIISLPLACMASSVRVRWCTCRPPAMVTQLVTRRSPEQSQAATLRATTSAGSSDPLPVTCNGGPARALNCIAMSCWFSSVLAASRRHVPYEVPTRAPAREGEHRQERVDVEVLVRRGELAITPLGLNRDA
jgi:hypothetical protein